MLAGDFEESLGGRIENPWRGAPKIRLSYNKRGKGKFFGTKLVNYDFDKDVDDFEAVTEENYNKILSGSTVVGAVLGGLPGAILGQLVGGKRQDVLVAITFKDKRRVLASMDKAHYTPLSTRRIAQAF